MTTVAGALSAAVEASGPADACIGGDGDEYDREVVAAIIAAFLRALPGAANLGCLGILTTAELANAVKEAARG